MKRKIRYKTGRPYKRQILVVAMIIGLLTVGLGGLLYSSEHYLNHQDFADYKIRGIDVSRHQGEIDWKQVDPQHYRFVFIKASEGGDYQDPKFAENWQQARQQGLVVGAYHFYRNCKSGAEQARNYISIVPSMADSLPPVIDVEFQKNCSDLTAEQLQQQIGIMAKMLEQHYAKKPIFYTTPNYYKAYIQGKFDDYSLWLQDLKNLPPKIDRRPWLFWQYSHTGQVNGIDTEVDLNVFRGHAQDFKRLIQPQSKSAENKNIIGE